MKRKNYLKKLAAWIFVIGLIQVFTFFTIAPSRLETKLLPPHFQVSHKYDTAYVRDFPPAMEDGSPSTQYMGHNLSADSLTLQRNLGVKKVLFAPKRIGRDPDEKQYKVFYSTWFERSDWGMLLNFFNVFQFEYLWVNGVRYERIVRYRWCILFWIESFESISVVPDCFLEQVKNRDS